MVALTVDLVGLLVILLAVVLVFLGVVVICCGIIVGCVIGIGCVVGIIFWRVVVSQFKPERMLAFSTSKSMYCGGTVMGM